MLHISYKVNMSFVPNNNRKTRDTESERWPFCKGRHKTKSIRIFDRHLYVGGPNIKITPQQWVVIARKLDADFMVK